MSCLGCAHRAGDAAAVLADAQASLMRSQFYLRPTIRPEPRQVTALRGRLAGLWRQHSAIQARLRQSQPPLGLWPAIIVGVSALVTTLGAWAWKHREEAREVELRSELYNRMIEEGLSPDRAAGLAMGAETPLTDVLRKLTLLSLVAGAIYVAYKVFT